MPGFLVAQVALDRIARSPRTDIQLRYVSAGIAPIGSVFAANPRDLIDVLRRAGMQPFHSGAFDVTGDIPAEILADLTAKAKGLSGIKVFAPQSGNPLGAQAFTSGSDIHFQPSNTPLMVHEAAHAVQQRSNR